ncbi:mechanosensitive ion channel family protein [Dongia soli]|uniref:Small-conductance mechanosensitive channel n=1 Tax=Dongia soli TaxID=600628 RepID=A0ABU5EDQ5_9PROT|nr:mechanosensitive ion channel family protein [Dongia soli]MDY0884485.1 mechanosensitive ion channel family protein [Dongia soli]
MLPLIEPLVATVLILLFVLSWRFMPQRHMWIGLISTTLLFVLLSVIVIDSAGSPLNPRFDRGPAPIELWHRIIVAAWWILGARIAVAIGSATLPTARGSREAKLASDLISGGVYLAAVLIVINTVFNVPIGGLVATSGVIAIVLGLALQNTLADVFAGVAVQIEGPVSLGDRIWIEGPVEGEIVQINWRSIHIRTDGNDIAVVPHSVVAKSRIINRSYPTARRGDTIEISCDPRVNPDHTCDLLKRALLLCPNVMRDPEPSVALVRLGSRSNHYQIAFSVASSSLLWSTKSMLMKEIARQFRYEGIRPAERKPSERISWSGHMGNGALAEKLGDKGAAEGEASDSGIASPLLGAYPLDQLLSELSIFHGLSQAHRQRLVGKLIRRMLEPRDIVFSQDDTGSSLFIIASGVLEVTRQMPERSFVVGRIGPGDYIGEIGMLTGAPHAATVTALTPCILHELCKSDVAPLLEEEPELVSAFEASARRGQERLARAAAAATCSHPGPPGQLLTRIRSFFNLPT